MDDRPSRRVPDEQSLPVEAHLGAPISPSYTAMTPSNGVGDGVGAADPEHTLPARFTQITASPVDVLIDSTVTVISTPLIFSDQLPPAFSLARSVDCAPPVPSLPARVIKTSTFGRRNDGKG